MGNREKYNQCMRPFITGSKPKEQRKQDFCIGAKICSGKAKNTDEAQRICSQPKPPKLQALKPKRQHGGGLTRDQTCEPNQFMDIASRFKDVYLNIQGEKCVPCVTLHDGIEAAEAENQIAYPVINIPEMCAEILDVLGIDAFPTIVKMSKGKVISKHVGSPEELIEKMKRGE